MADCVNINPAEQASIDCLKKVFEAITANKNFLVEAGAGAGKTFTLIKALRTQIEKNSSEFIKSNKRIACITYTNVAKEEIKSRTDNHPIIYSETIHAFGWEIIKDFQKALRTHIPNLNERWKARIDEVGGLKNQEVIYNLGYPKLTDTEIFLHHDDVIKLLTFLLDDKKFQIILTSKFPIIFIDEYQDTNKAFADAIVRNFIETQTGPLFGFFGDHWQKIYGSNSCGLIEASAGKLITIGKQANFRSDKFIVDSLNKMRPELKQNVCNPDSKGEIRVFHSNNWQGQRRTDNHWQGDLPEAASHEYLEKVLELLKVEGWNINPDTTKILMLTNNVLAAEQGYINLYKAFGDSDDFLKKNNEYIELLADVIEPGAVAFTNGKFGEMFQAFNVNIPKIRKHSDKEAWHQDMIKLNEFRSNGTVGDVIELLKKTKKPSLSRRVEEKETKYSQLLQKPENERVDEEKIFMQKIQGIKAIPYPEVINAVKYIDDQTIFSTKHGVKGAQFENVLIVFGRGWNHYNWNQMLEWMNDGVPNGKQDTFERNRNLFYVACSRPKKRLCLLFTQELSDRALTTLSSLFGNNINPLN